MLSCDQVARELSDALDRDLPVWRRMQIRMHLAMCERCKQLSSSLQRTLEVLHSLADETPDEPDREGGDGSPAE